MRFNNENPIVSECFTKKDIADIVLKWKNFWSVLVVKNLKLLIQSEKIIILKYFTYKKVFILMCLSSEKDIVFMRFDNENPIVTECFTRENRYCYKFSS